jgi:hypothetical protein
VSWPRSGRELECAQLAIDESGFQTARRQAALANIRLNERANASVSDADDQVGGSFCK